MLSLRAQQVTLSAEKLEQDSKKVVDHSEAAKLVVAAVKLLIDAFNPVKSAAEMNGESIRSTILHKFFYRLTSV